MLDVVYFILFLTMYSKGLSKDNEWKTVEKKVRKKKYEDKKSEDKNLLKNHI